MKNNSYKLFFIIFYIIGVILILNVLVAFIIDYLVSEWDRKSKEFDEEKLLKENLLNRKEFLSNIDENLNI